MNSSVIPNSASGTSRTIPAPYLSALPCRAWNRLDLVLASLLFVLSLALYTKTLAPTISSVSFDSAELITKSTQIRMAHMPGSPVYIWGAHLFTRLPFGEIATRVNWMSALMAALTVGLLYLLIVRHVTGERLGALGGSVMFAVSVTFWSQAVITELYTTNLAFILAGMLALLEWAAIRSQQSEDDRRRLPIGERTAKSKIQNPKVRSRFWLVLAALLFGLSMGVHLSNVLLVPVLAIFVLLGWPVRRTGIFSWRRDIWPPKERQFDIASGALASLVGLVAVVVPLLWVYMVLPLVPTGDGFPKAESGWPQFYTSTFSAFSDWRFVYTWPQIPDRIVIFLRLLYQNMGPIGIGLLLLGAARMLWTRTRLFYLLVPVALTNIIFYINYKAPDLDPFFLPSYWVGAAFIATGLNAVAIGVRFLVRLRFPERKSAPVPHRSQTQFGITARLLPIGQAPQWLAAGLVAVIISAGTLWNLQVSYPHTDRSNDFSFRDFYGNIFNELPEGAYYYHRGAAMGYDLLYYTELYKVRPDLHIQAGPARDEPRRPPWPTGPVYAGTNKYDLYLPAFLADEKKWYDQWIFGTFNWKSNILWGWLKSYKVRRDLPEEWMVRATSPDAQPSNVVNLPFTSYLTLVGYDAEPQAQRGRPWHFVRYWRTTLDHIPPMATIIGDHQAVEIHSPLSDQLTDYIRARKISKTELGDYIVRDDMHLVIPWNLAPGRYNISNSTINRSIGSLMYEPASPKSLVPREKFIMTLEVTDAPSIDPLHLPTDKVGK